MTLHCFLHRAVFLVFFLENIFIVSEFHRHGIFLFGHYGYIITYPSLFYSDFTLRHLLCIYLFVCFPPHMNPSVWCGVQEHQREGGESGGCYKGTEPWSSQHTDTHKHEGRSQLLHCGV